jgi:hypothetical protein
LAEQWACQSRKGNWPAYRAGRPIDPGDQATSYRLVAEETTRGQEDRLQRIEARAEGAALCSASWEGVRGQYITPAPQARRGSGLAVHWIDPRAGSYGPARRRIEPGARGPSRVVTPLRDLLALGRHARRDRRPGLSGSRPTRCTSQRVRGCVRQDDEGRRAHRVPNIHLVVGPALHTETQHRRLRRLGVARTAWHRPCSPECGRRSLGEREGTSADPNSRRTAATRDSAPH